MGDFIKNLWEGLCGWFIDDKGWLTVLTVAAYVVIGLTLIKFVLRGVEKAEKASEKLPGKTSKLARKFLANVLRVVLYSVFVIILFNLIGLDLSNIVTMLSAVGVALSLAMQKVAGNFASGMILVANKPFEEGDYISCGGVEGTVIDIAMFSTKLLTPDNKLAVVPNSSLADNSVINYSAKPTRRVDLTFSVSYDSDIDKVKRAIESVLDKNDLIRHDDGYTIRLKEHGESSLVFVCRFWVDKANYWATYFDVTEGVFNKFKQEGIEIPYNKLDVNIFSNEKKSE